MNVSGGSPSSSSFSGVESPGTRITINANAAYSVTESGGLSGYSSSSSSACTSPTGLAPGSTVTCTITNDDQAPSLTLNKVVVNNNGGLQPESAWTLTATGTGGSPTNLSGPGAPGSADVVSGPTFKADTYTLAETGPSGYSPSLWSCTNSVTVTSSQITLANGQSTVCTITNDDLAAAAYLFTGFFSPIDNLPTVNSAQAGQAIPVKWRLTDVYGNPISDPSSFVSLTSTSATCSGWTTGSADTIETYTGNSGLQYLGNGYWQYNWKTPKSYASSCRVMKLTLLDGSIHTAALTFVK